MQYRGQDPVVVGIPRGGVVLAREIWIALGGELDVVLAHKLGYPGQEELAMGAVSENGKVILNQSVLSSMPVAEWQIEAETTRQTERMAQRSRAIRLLRPRVQLEGRLVIVVDDGVATGATTRVAIGVVRAESPSRLVAAFPVGPEETIQELAELVDEVLCLEAPRPFYAVGQFYTRFDPVEEAEMLGILAGASKANRVASDSV